MVCCQHIYIAKASSETFLPLLLHHVGLTDGRKRNEDVNEAICQW